MESRLTQDYLQTAQDYAATHPGANIGQFTDAVHQDLTSKYGASTASAVGTAETGFFLNADSPGLDQALKNLTQVGGQVGE